jgi:hypothetical protein
MPYLVFFMRNSTKYSVFIGFLAFDFNKNALNVRQKAIFIFSEILGESHD